MPLQNIYLENEGKKFTADQRRASWNSEEMVNDPPITDHPVKLGGQLADLMTTFIKEEWIKSGPEPREELGLMFTVHKKVLLALLDQPDCEGLRIYFSSQNSGQVRTNLVLKPVDKNLDELDAVRSEGVIKFCEKATECPPETRCPSESLDNLKKE